MTETRAFLILLAVGMFVLSALWVGLDSLGVSRENLIYVALAVVCVFGFFSGYLPDRYPRHPRRR